MLTIIILGTIFIVKFKELAFFILLITLPITVLSFLIALIVILMGFSNPIETLNQDEIEKIYKSNPNIKYNQGNVKVLSKSGLRKLKTLGVIFLSYIILCGITYIMMILTGF